MSVVLYHNPRCSTSRQALELLRENGVEPQIVEYLKTGWDAETLKRLAASAGGGLKGLLRTKEAAAAALISSGADDAAVLQAVIADPILVERPIAEGPGGARVGRPIERVLEVI